MKENSKGSNEQLGKLNMQQELDRPGKLMVSGIPKLKDYSNSDLEKEFTPFGRITEVYIIRDQRTNIPRGYAFVTFENPQDSEDAIKAMEGKDIGGESKVHCEQARIGLKKSTMLKNQEQAVRGGGNESNAGRGVHRGGGLMDRGRGMMMDRGRGMMDRGRGMMMRGMMMDRGRGMMMMDRGRGMMDRGRGMMDRGRGLMNRGGRGMPLMGRAMFDEEAFDFQQGEFFEEFYELEPPFMRFPPPTGGRGGPPMRGALSGRGRPTSQGSAPLGARKALLPDPLGRGGRAAASYPGLLGPPPSEDFYGDDANEADYYGDQGNPYAEGNDETYPEEVDFPSEEYYEQEWRVPPRGRGALGSRGRGLIPRGMAESRTPRHQMDDYGYEAEDAPPQRSRAPAPVPRRGAHEYAEELYEEEEEDIRVAGVPSDPYSRGRGRPQASGVPSASSARLGRGGPAGRGGAGPVRRVEPLLEADPYAEEDPNLYERAVHPSAALKGGARAAPDYDDDPYADPYRQQRVAAGVSRQAAVGRSRAALMSSDAMYPGERSQPKPLMETNTGTSRIATLGPSSRVDDDDEDEYQNQEIMAAQARAAYSEGRRPPVRRGDPDFDRIEEMYDRMAAETDYPSYPASSRVPGDPFSDPYSRKRPVDPYDDPEMGSHGMPATRREYDDLRSAAINAAKRERVDRSGDRGGYDPYSRQDGLFNRGL